MLISFIFPVSWLQAQEVETRPISEDNKVWKHLFLNYTREYLTDGDTLIAENQCYRVYLKILENDSITSYSYYGAIFDEGEKTYFIYPNTTEPQLILDFGVSEGDDLTMCFKITMKDYELWVEQDTIIQSCNRYYRRLLMHNITNEQNDPDGGDYYAPGYWIKGIGSTASPYFADTYFWYNALWFRLAECSVNGEAIYRHPYYNPETNAIEPERVTSRECDNSLYDLSGHRVADGSEFFLRHDSESGRAERQGSCFKLPKGVYIQNGKKFVVKE